MSKETHIEIEKNSPNRKEVEYKLNQLLENRNRVNRVFENKIDKLFKQENASTQEIGFIESNFGKYKAAGNHSNTYKIKSGLLIESGVILPKLSAYIREQVKQGLENQIGIELDLSYEKIKTLAWERTETKESGKNYFPINILMSQPSIFGPDDCSEGRSAEPGYSDYNMGSAKLFAMIDDIIKEECKKKDIKTQPVIKSLNLSGHKYHKGAEIIGGADTSCIEALQTPVEFLYLNDCKMKEATFSDFKKVYREVKLNNNPNLKVSRILRDDYRMKFDNSTVQTSRWLNISDWFSGVRDYIGRLFSFDTEKLAELFSRSSKSSKFEGWNKKLQEEGDELTLSSSSNENSEHNIEDGLVTYQVDQTKLVNNKRSQRYKVTTFGFSEDGDLTAVVHSSDKVNEDFSLSNKINDGDNGFDNTKELPTVTNRSPSTKPSGFQALLALIGIVGKSK